MSIEQENLIPVTGDYLPGQRFIMVDETLVPVGFGTPYIPGSTVIKPSAVGVYYKCASVDTANSKWTGYKATQLEDGTWSFAEEITTDLSFTEIKPEKDSIYSYDALVKVKLWNGSLIPEEGLVFHVSLGTENFSTAETGQTVNENTAMFTTVDGIPCHYFEYTNISFANDGMPTGGNPRTLSAWVRSSSWDMGQIFGYGNTNPHEMCYIAQNSGIGGCFNVFDAWSTDFEREVWYHVVLVVRDSSNVSVYLNGAKAQDYTGTVNTVGTDYISCGCRVDYSEYYVGYLAGCRIYNRVLTDDEILALSQEFTPTV